VPSSGTSTPDSSENRSEDQKLITNDDKKEELPPEIVEPVLPPVPITVAPPVVEVQPPVCTQDNRSVCTRRGDDNYMSFHKHLACAGVLAPKSDCEGAKCERRAKRKEVAAMAVKIG